MMTVEEEINLPKMIDKGTSLSIKVVFIRYIGIQRTTEAVTTLDMIENIGKSLVQDHVLLHLLHQKKEK
jgi:hypothetical protein